MVGREIAATVSVSGVRNLDTTGEDLPVVLTLSCGPCHDFMIGLTGNSKANVQNGAERTSQRLSMQWENGSHI
jgi:hypothetical protein